MEIRERKCVTEKGVRKRHTVLPVTTIETAAATEIVVDTGSWTTTNNCSPFKQPCSLQTERFAVEEEGNTLKLAAEVKPILLECRSTDSSYYSLSMHKDQSSNMNSRDFERSHEQNVNYQGSKPLLSSQNLHQEQNSGLNLFSSSLVAWKNSALLVAENFYQRFNLFRKTKSSDNDSQREDGKIKTVHTHSLYGEQSSTSNDRAKRFSSSQNNDETNENQLDKKLSSSDEGVDVDESNKRTKNMQTKLNLSSDICEVTKLYNENVEPGFSDSYFSKTASNDSLDKLSEEKNDLQPVVEHQNFTASPLCTPCLGSKHQSSTNILTDTTLVASNDAANLVYDRLESKVKLKPQSKIIHKQPIYPQSCDDTVSKTTEFLFPKQNYENHFNPYSYSPNCSGDENNSSLRAAVDIPREGLVKSGNTDAQILSRGMFNERQREKLCFVTKNEAIDPYLSSKVCSELKSYKAFVPNKQDTTEYASEKYSVNLWELRNSLEQNTIELKCIRTTFSDSDDDTQRRRISIATTDGLTEISPMSTPSSERLISHERSMSDSDEESRACFVPSCDRLSPMQPRRLSRKSSGFLSSSESVIYKASIDEFVRDSTENLIFNVDNFENSNPHPYHQSNDAVITKVTKEHRLNRLCDKFDEGGKQSVLGQSKGNKNCHLTVDSKLQIVHSRDVQLKETHKEPLSSEKTSPAKKKLGRNMLLPLEFGHRGEYDSKLQDHENCIHPTIIAFVDDDDDRNSDSNQDCDSSKNKYGKQSLREEHSLANEARTFKIDEKKPQNALIVSEKAVHRRKMFVATNSASSDDVFLNDPINCTTPFKTNASQISKLASPSQKTLKQNISSSIQTQSLTRRSSTSTPCYRGATFPLSFNDTTFVPPTYYGNQRCKYQTRPGSANSSGASSPSSPTRISPMSHRPHRGKSKDRDSDDSLSSQTSGSKSPSSIKTLSRLLRRTNKHKRSDSVPTFCGYAMGRDNCVDPVTDRIFKEFLFGGPTSPSSSCGSFEPLPPPSHMLPPPPLNSSSATQLRRMVMKKQYSDSIAMYYGQRQRRWKFTKQKSGSVGCPVEPKTLQRQERIDEEFDPEEINQRISSTSTQRESERADFVLPTVNELKEWRRSSQDRIPVSCHISKWRDKKSLSTDCDTTLNDRGTPASTRRVTFVEDQFDKEISTIRTLAKEDA